MTESDQNDPASAPSEKTKPDAVSPSDRIRPDSPASQSPPLIQLPDAPLLGTMPGPKSIRPPPLGMPRLTPKPSSVPPPRLRPAAPPESANNIGPGTSLDSPLLTQAEISATQEIADAISTDQQEYRREIASNRAAAAPKSGSAPVARIQKRAGGADPFFIRRTIIPILLTGGMILAGAGAMLMFGGGDNALSDLFPSWVPIMFCVLASIFLGFGVLNIIAMKNAK